MHVPLWRVLLNEAKVTPQDITSLLDVPKLPITHKETFMGRIGEEYIDGSRMAHSMWYVTSGTSGTPFRFLMSDLAVQEKYIDVASLRFLWWREAPFRNLSLVRIARIKIRGPSSDRALFIPVEHLLAHPTEVLAQLADFKPEVLSTYPSLLLEIARHISKSPELPRPRPRYVLSFGEMLFPSVRKYITEMLGCEVYDRYGLEEIGVVGIECAEHNGFHINTESVFVEITDDSGRPCSPGTPGRVVATSLVNYNMPFIRYDTGDSGTISYQPCACGLRSPRLWIRGRYSAYLSFPTRRIHHLEFDGAMDGFMNEVYQYQIAKKSDSHVIARIVPGRSFHAHTVNKISESLRQLVGSSIRVEVKEVERIPPTPLGKSRIVSNESLTDGV